MGLRLLEEGEIPNFSHCDGRGRKRAGGETATLSLYSSATLLKGPLSPRALMDQRARASPPNTFATQSSWLKNGRELWLMERPRRVLTSLVGWGSPAHV